MFYKPGDTATCRVITSYTKTFRMVISWTKLSPVISPCISGILDE